MTGRFRRRARRVAWLRLTVEKRLFNQILLLLNLIAVGLLLWQGDVEDRLGVGLIVLATLSEILTARVLIGTWPVGLVATNVVLFLGLWWLCERYDRWWLFGVASVELIILVTHFIPLFASDLSFWTLTTVRLVLWSVVSLILFIGALEARAARQYRL
jgi:hypothetical protein